MVLEEQILPYFQWLLSGDDQSMGALLRFLLVFAGLSTLGLLLGFLIAASRRGIMRGGDLTYHAVAGGFRELADSSPRRIWALARLAVKESIRRRVVVALAVFFLVLLFANWFLSVEHQQPARLYLSFVLTACTYLVLGVALLLSAFSLPADFKSKTIYTVVTKPVRAGEIILGRIIGFTIVATVLLAIMGLGSYVFVIRSLHHTHDIRAVDLSRSDDSAADSRIQQGVTTKAAGHAHDVTIDADGFGRTNMANGHTHDVEKAGDGYRLSGPVGFMRAREPKYGKLEFIDRSGAAKDRGISVGSEWGYRSFIDGNTPATAIWTFSGIDESIDPLAETDEEKVLPLALIVRVFKTHKGVIGQALTGTIQLRNPETEVTTEPLPFPALDQQVAEFDLKRAQTETPTGRDLDIFKDLVSSKGEIQVLVKCLDRGQYFGFAQADAYLRLPEGSPAVSYTKVLASIWVQAVIVIAVGVTISTLVSGPIAMLFTAAFIILGFYRTTFLEIANKQNYGGGPAESIVRIADQSNVTSALDEGALTTIVTKFDEWISRPIMWCIGQCLPDFGALSTVDFAAEGYNVPWDRVFQDITTCVGYVLVLSILGFFLLRTREVAN
jgi:ABC-type transport system involved in multi-copper enzyme maturation permease subunit